jgi:hypothetical protein
MSLNFDAKGQRKQELVDGISEAVKLTPKISSDQIWVAGYFGQPMTYPYFAIFSSHFLCNSLKS